MYQKFKYKEAFTLIEVIMSVVIILIVVVGILAAQSKNSKMAEYVMKRGNSELGNSLFLTKKVQKYTNDKKSSYDLLVDEFSIKDSESRELLKTIEKQVNITDWIEIPISMEEGGPVLFTFYTNEILLKADYSARYYTFK